MQSFQENRLSIFQDLIVMKPLISLISCPVACSAIIAVDTHTDTHTHTHTHKPNTVTLAVHMHAHQELTRYDIA